MARASALSFEEPAPPREASAAEADRVSPLLPLSLSAQLSPSLSFLASALPPSPGASHTPPPHPPQSANAYIGIFSSGPLSPSLSLTRSLLLSLSRQPSRSRSRTPRAERRRGAQGEIPKPGTFGTRNSRPLEPGACECECECAYECECECVCVSVSVSVVHGLQPTRSRSLPPRANPAPPMQTG